MSLVFLALPSAEPAIQRVLERVAQGGHFVPEGIVRRRFQAGKANFDAVYEPLVSAWALDDNSDIEPVLLGLASSGGLRGIICAGRSACAQRAADVMRLKLDENLPTILVGG